MKPIRIVLPLLLIAGASTTVRAQGADLCANAQVITGTGSFPFDNTTASTDGTADPACNFFGQSDITNDVWFSWTASTTGVFTVATCGASMDSKIAVYASSCASAVIACNDDSCALQSSLDVAVTSGTTYIIRLGNYPGAVPGTGSMSINPQGQLAVLDTQVSSVNGHTYMLLAGGSWTNAENTAVALGGHLATVRSQAEHDWLTATWHNYQGIDIDMWIGLTDQAVEGTFVWISGEPVTYTNWDTGEPNDGGTGEDYADMRKNNPNAYWNDLPDAPPITGAHYNPHGVVEINTAPGTPFCLGDGSGTACPCGNNSAVGNNQGCLSSLGVGANLAATGSASVTNDTIVLSGTNMPNSTCLYFQGTSQQASGAGAVFGDGLRCAGGTIARLGTKTNVAGTSQYPVGADAHVSVKGAIPGRRRNAHLPGVVPQRRFVLHALDVQPDERVVARLGALMRRTARVEPPSHAERHS
jgi:hypothetical protein